MSDLPRSDIRKWLLIEYYYSINDYCPGAVLPGDRHVEHRKALLRVLLKGGQDLLAFSTSLEHPIDANLTSCFDDVRELMGMLMRINRWIPKNEVAWYYQMKDQRMRDEQDSYRYSLWRLKETMKERKWLFLELLREQKQAQELRLQKLQKQLQEQREKHLDVFLVGRGSGWLKEELQPFVIEKNEQLDVLTNRHELLQKHGALVEHIYDLLLSLCCHF